MVRNKLKEIRMKKYGMSREEFAKMIDVNIRSYYSYEKNYSRPTLLKALEIAAKLEMNIEDMWSIEE